MRHARLGYTLVAYESGQEQGDCSRPAGVPSLRFALCGHNAHEGVLASLNGTPQVRARLSRALGFAMLAFG